MDPFTLKEWYDIKAPSIFQVRNPGKTLVTRTKGTSEYDRRDSYGSINSIIDTRITSALWRRIPRENTYVRLALMYL